MRIRHLCRKISTMQNSNFRSQNDKEDFKIQFNKRLVVFSLDIIKFCSLVRQNANLKALADQLIRSGTSIGANIIEAKACGSKKEYIRFFEIALRSANETRYWLILLREADSRYQQTASILIEEANQLCKIITSAVLTMKGKTKI